METVLRAGMSKLLSSYVTEPLGSSRTETASGGDASLSVLLLEKCIQISAQTGDCDMQEIHLSPSGLPLLWYFFTFPSLSLVIYPMNSKTNPDGKIYKPENLDSLFLEKHDSLFSAASVCHGVCHEKMPELLKGARPTSALKKLSSSVTPCVMRAGSKRKCAALGGSRICPREGWSTKTFVLFRSIAGPCSTSFCWTDYACWVKFSASSLTLSIDSLEPNTHTRVSLKTKRAGPGPCSAQRTVCYQPGERGANRCRITVQLRETKVHHKINKQPVLQLPQMHHWVAGSTVCFWMCSEQVPAWGTV